MTPKQTKLAFGITIIAICIVLLVAAGIQKTSMHYFTVAELEAREADFIGKKIKLAGKVVPGSIIRDDGTLNLSFRVWEPVGDKGHTQARVVRYQGIVPDTFRDESDVVLEGKTLDNGTFAAEHLLAKCPSKYESKSYDEMKALHKDKPVEKS